ncbi:zinc-binding alcohol dehydrogenase family protein [Paenibacillus lentus]|uniref:zinc-binding alcohol dehydrogenase family protein n=1 Tax=Paenibacillus lentus TaxID=1338368 RepID=UPI003652270C
MKGIVCEEAGKFIYREDLPEPALKEGEAIIRIQRVGICGTDLHAYQGNQPYFTYPRVLGHELAGRIEAIGENSYKLHTGDQVSIIPYIHCGECIACRNGKTNCCVSMKVFGVHVDGGMRERIAVPISHLINTEGLTLDQSAMLEPLAIGAHAVRRSGLQPEETALVIGAGPIGLGIMALAKALGAKVIAMDVNEERLKYCRSWAKVDDTVNALEQPKEQISLITKGEFPTVVFDATGNVKSMMGAFNLASHGGRIVFVGLVKDEITFDDPEFHSRELTLMGSRNATKADFDHVLSVIRNGHMDISRYITHGSAFGNMINEFNAWLKPESKVIKAVVRLED